MRLNIKGFFVLLVFLLTSCHVIHPTHPTSIQQTQAIMRQSIEIDKGRAAGNASAYSTPARINAALLPPLLFSLISSAKTLFCTINV